MVFPADNEHRAEVPCHFGLQLLFYPVLEFVVSDFLSNKALLLPDLYNYGKITVLQNTVV
jgi:hypothetical protein